MLARLHRRHAGLSPLPVRPRVCHPAEGPSVFLWGVASGHWIALGSAALAAAKGLQVAVIDAAAAFQATSPVATEACRVPPGTLLRPVTIARAFTCWQVVTLVTERLTPLPAREPIALIVLLGPLTPHSPPPLRSGPVARSRR